MKGQAHTGEMAANRGINEEADEKTRREREREREDVEEVKLR